jgi:sigma-B regulation protein RsbU (phosphoserine phosphatase)
MSDQRSETPQDSILIVDDAPANLHLLSEMLSKRGYGVRAVTGGERALASVRTDPPNLVLLDIRMPGMNGYEVCRHLQADPRTRHIPVIFLSALDELHDKVQAFAVGGVDYVTKPFQGEEVLARVETHLALRKLQNQLREANRKLRDTNRRMARELALAGKVQASFLPREPAAIPGWQIAAALKPARQTSGDFYDLISLPDGRLGLLIADVVDKGVAAALFMALSWILIRTYAAEHPTHPELVLSAVNHRVLAETDTDQFVTVFYGILDPAVGTLTYCNAGHPPPLLLGAQYGDVAQPLSKTGMALGVVETETWEQATVRLDPGDVLVLYSDGITDAENQQETSFGYERLKTTVLADLRRPAQEIQDSLLTEIKQFVGEAIQSDDITVMVVVRDS